MNEMTKKELRYTLKEAELILTSAIEENHLKNKNEDNKDLIKDRDYIRQELKKFENSFINLSFDIYI